MKKPLFVAAGFCLIYLMGLSQKVAKEKKDDHDMQGMFIDLNTTNLVDLCYDSIRHKTLNLSNAREIYFFINPETGDTIYGRGGYIVNGLVMRGNDNRYHLNPKLVVVENGQLKTRSNGAVIKNSGYLIKNINCNLKDGPILSQYGSKKRDLKSKTDSQDDKKMEGKVKNESAKNFAKDKS
jgi:hypothetical protein